MVDADVVLVLMLNIRIGVDRVAVGCGVERASRGIYGLDETNQSGVNQASRNYVVGKGLACKPRGSCSRGSSEGVIDLVINVNDPFTVSDPIVANTAGEAGRAYSAEIAA